MNARTKGVVVATAVAGLFLAKAGVARAAGDKTEAKTVHCEGINACKGQGACGGVGHDCAGKNECKGKGWIDVSAEECKTKGGTIKH